MHGEHERCKVRDAGEGGSPLREFKVALQAYDIDIVNARLTMVH